MVNKCNKCKLTTVVYLLVDDRQPLNERKNYLFCGYCLFKFINKLADYKDFDLQEEVEFYLK